jgi:hypothetical protein
MAWGSSTAGGHAQAQAHMPAMLATRQQREAVSNRGQCIAALQLSTASRGVLEPAVSHSSGPSVGDTRCATHKRRCHALFSCNCCGLQSCIELCNVAAYPKTKCNMHVMPPAPTSSLLRVYFRLSNFFLQAHIKHTSSTEVCQSQRSPIVPHTTGCMLLPMPGALDRAVTVY